MRGIYVASKSKWGGMWLRHREKYPIISSWIDEYEQGETTDWSDLWQRNVHEASTAGSMVVYLPSGDEPKGGLFVEMGATLAVGNPVFFVGETACSVLKHPKIVVCSSVEEALGQALQHVQNGRQGKRSMNSFRESIARNRQLAKEIEPKPCQVHGLNLDSNCAACVRCAADWLAHSYLTSNIDGYESLANAIDTIEELSPEDLAAMFQKEPKAP